MKRSFFKFLVCLTILSMLLVSVQVPLLAAGEVDLALKKSVTVSGNWDGDPEEAKQYKPEYVTDGDETTRWAAKADDEGMFWCTIDLGKVNSLNKIDVKFEMAEGTFDVEASKDGVKYDAIETELQATNNLKDQDELGSDEITFNAVSARYIRITSATYMSIWSLKVFEAKAPAKTVAPTAAPTTAAPTTPAPTTAAPTTAASASATAYASPSATDIVTGTQAGKGDSTLTIVIIVGAIVIAGGVAYFIFKKKKAA